MERRTEVLDALKGIDCALSALLGFADLMERSGNLRPASAVRLMALEIDERAGTLRAVLDD